MEGKNRLSGFTILSPESRLGFTNALLLNWKGGMAELMYRLGQEYTDIYKARSKNMSFGIILCKSEGNLLSMTPDY